MVESHAGSQKNLPLGSGTWQLDARLVGHNTSVAKPGTSGREIPSSWKEQSVGRDVARRGSGVRFSTFHRFSRQGFWDIQLPIFFFPLSALLNSFILFFSGGGWGEPSHQFMYFYASKQAVPKMYRRRRLQVSGPGSPVTFSFLTKVGLSISDLNSL